MGLLTVLRKLKQKEREIRILMLGLDNAGKTTVLKRINGEDISSISPTLGFNIKTLEHNNYKLNIWDVGGQKSIRSYWRNYFEQTDGLVWVVDSADRSDRMDDCKRELRELLKEEVRTPLLFSNADLPFNSIYHSFAAQRLAGASLLILANKQDVPGARTQQQIAEILDLASIQTHHWHIVACSAVTGENLLTGMDWIVADIAARIYMLD
ncbi:ADP-ribosylation factor family-domain-containing protein [Gaertneriomyces semiglobifer]|nr:ADP-ribosylation factor family-domain-containing protein [Gaertneriomyces semiglobifer]